MSERRKVFCRLVQRIHTFSSQHVFLRHFVKTMSTAINRANEEFFGHSDQVISALNSEIFVKGSYLESWFFALKNSSQYIQNSRTGIFPDQKSFDTYGLFGSIEFISFTDWWVTRGFDKFCDGFFSLKFKFISNSKRKNCIGISLEVAKDIPLESLGKDFATVVAQFRKMYDCGGYLSCAPMAWLIYKNRISSRSIIEYLKIYEVCENYRRNSRLVKLWKIGEQFKLNPRAMVKASDSPSEIIEKHIVMGQTVSAAYRKGKLLALNASNGIFPKI